MRAGLQLQAANKHHVGPNPVMYDLQCFTTVEKITNSLVMEIACAAVC